ncbi:hypothetical protein GX51_02403 [Blastomyces parvus]|uniref:Uncharacterized protein n=1 Tax=Blastomyces parvus TaxID=2060905 RepID=A0A2B7XC93_9EURO|nr:hypothetical protein GX51_02403 [Blastomyces parvus]
MNRQNTNVSRAVSQSKDKATEKSKIHHVECHRHPLPVFRSRYPTSPSTNSEVENATLLVKHNQYKVVKVGDGFVVKFGRAGQFDLVGGLKMLFVQQPAEEVTLHSDLIPLTSYIVMEFIEGDTLDIQETHLNRCGRYFKELRVLSFPGFCP